MASLPRTYGDLGNLDARGRAVLYHADDMKKEGIQLREGLRVLVWDGDYEAEGTLEYYEGHWRARIDWEHPLTRRPGTDFPRNTGSDCPIRFEPFRLRTLIAPVPAPD